MKKRYEVELIAPGERDFEKNGIKIKALGLSRNRLTRMLKTVKALFYALGSKADVYHFHDPELIWVGLLLKILGKKVIYDVHENNPEYIRSKKWVRPAFIRPLISVAVYHLENFAAGSLDGVVVVNELLYKRFKKFNNNVEEVLNFPPKDFGKGFSSSGPTFREKKVLYIGGIEKNRGVLKMLEFVKKFKNFPLKILFIGPVKDKSLEQTIASTIRKEKIPLSQFELKATIPHNDLPRYLNKAFVGIVPFLKNQNNYLGTPLKLFEYMAYGLPIVASDFLFIGKFLRESRSGLLIKDPENISEYKEAFEKLISDSKLWEKLSANGRKAYLERYNWEREEKKLIGLYEKILS